MEKTKINFYCPTSTVAIIDRIADKDHRDRTSMLNKIISFYLENNGESPKPTTRKKAGSR
jgi:hypothetical protein